MQPTDVDSLIIFKRDLVTAEIVYHMPDYPGLLQTFIWQDYDTPPEYPRFKAFLQYWADNLDGALHSATIVATETHEHIFTPFDIIT